MNFRQEVEVCIQTLSTRSFHHLSSDLQSESHRIVNDLFRMFAENSNLFDLQSRQIKSLSSHIFDTCNLKYVFTILRSHTNSHYVISQCDDLICFSKRSNSRSSNLHMLAKIFRVNSRSRFSRHLLSRFSKISHLKTLLRAFCHLLI